MAHRLDRTERITPLKRYGAPFEITATYQGFRPDKGHLFEMILPKPDFSVGLLSTALVHLASLSVGHFDVTLNTQADGHIVAHWFEQEDEMSTPYYNQLKGR